MGKPYSFFLKSLYDYLVIEIGPIMEAKRMKEMKKWFLLLMAAFMLTGIATGCTNEDNGTDDTNTEETETNEEGTEEEGTEEEGQ
ncbi:hypothetical protein CVD28_06230 [Bacillus sp. M6-12]|nr:hypothetical protein CVD28_06230 [Bacillus sp. M6-12]